MLAEAPQPNTVGKTVFGMTEGEIHVHSPAEPGCDSEGCPLSWVEPWRAMSAEPEPERRAQPAEAAARVRGLEGGGTGSGSGDTDEGTSNALCRN